MKILIVGAGALGGYFGARLLEQQRDVTFLLRPGRVAQLAKTGLVIKSRYGDLALPPPPHVLAQDLADGKAGPYDLVVVGCKAYDLEDTMASFAPAVGPGTTILPLLNGMRHIERLVARFGETAVLGGQCFLAGQLDEAGVMHHLNDTHRLTFGERSGGMSARTAALEAIFAGANFESKASAEIMQEMWEKWIYITSAAGITCLMRGSVGDLVAGGGAELSKLLVGECVAIAKANGFVPRPATTERTLTMLTAPGAATTASMLRDLSSGARIEADHIVGDMIARSKEALPPQSMLRIVYANLKTYEARSARLAAA